MLTPIVENIVCSPEWSVRLIIGTSRKQKNCYKLAFNLGYSVGAVSENQNTKKLGRYDAAPPL